MKLFLDTIQAAAFLGIDKRTFERRYIDKAKIRAIQFPCRVGYKNMFLRQDVEKLKPCST